MSRVEEMENGVDAKLNVYVILTAHDDCASYLWLILNDLRVMGLCAAWHKLESRCAFQGTDLENLNQMHIAVGGFIKKQCLSDRGSHRNLCYFLDMSKLSLLEDDSKNPKSKHFKAGKTSGFDRIYHQLIPPITCADIARKRKRKGSRSRSCRSSDKSKTKINVPDPPTRCASVTYATCSNFPFPGTDSSGELFYNRDSNWGSGMIIPMSEMRNRLKREGKDVGGEPIFS
ncbi:hypothetical protein KI387_028818 [Taxus chinensis]|uniref:Uncharacterized protein n=1 Tax=Taxus chinensis TaxID=29808 RepID=A0AA38CDN7_TAXCH|nr:hypothetical protein KI387_028818 [Taxus chinensis]